MLRAKRNYKTKAITRVKIGRNKNCNKKEKACNYRKGEM